MLEHAWRMAQGGETWSGADDTGPKDQSMYFTRYVELAVSIQRIPWDSCILLTGLVLRRRPFPKYTR